ncbi:MAG: hypothetical protein H0X29_03755 [Parachlamydiaceae bacterium]|nr:hypothetical protein [Parachlamydiaceae bacterium]
MGPIEFHNRLTHLSQANNFGEFAHRVLGGHQAPCVMDVAVVYKVNEEVQKLFIENQKHLAQFHLLPLKSLVDKFTDWTKEGVQKRSREGVVKNNNAVILLPFIEQIKGAIKLAEEDSSLPLMLPPDIFSLSDGYCSMTESINVCLTGRPISPKILKQSIAAAKSEEFEEFLKEVRQRFKWHPHIFDQMIDMFFKHAPVSAQAKFFSFLNKGDENLLNTIISMLPADISDLSLSNCKLLRDSHVVKIVERFNSLRYLSLKNCSNITNAALVALAQGSNMANLNNLNLRNCFQINDNAIKTLVSSPAMANLSNFNLRNCYRISDLAISAIAKSSNMSKLNNLNLRSCYRITSKAIRAIGESSNMFNLHSLNLANCYRLTDAGIAALARGSNMINMEKINLQDCNKLTDAAIVGLAKSPHMMNLISLNLKNCYHLTDMAFSEVANSPSMAKLQSLNLNLCDLLTDIGIWSIIRSPNMFKLESLDLEGCNDIAEETKLAVVNKLKENFNRNALLGTETDTSFVK